MQISHNKLYHASILVAISGILYGLLGYFGTLAQQENMSICTMLAWRFIIAGIWVFLFSIKKSHMDKIFTMDKRVLIHVFILSAISYAGSSAFYFIASQHVGTGLAMAMLCSYPIAVALYLWIAYKKGFDFKIILALTTMLAGLFLLPDFSSTSFNTIGILFGLLAAICYAIYVLGSKQFASIAIDSNIITMIVCFSCAVSFIALSIYTQDFLFPTSVKSWLYLLALGIFATALPIQLMLKGLKYISAMRASMISLLEPLVTVVVGVICLNESFSLLQALGVSMILGGAITAHLQKETP